MRQVSRDWGGGGHLGWVTKKEISEAFTRAGRKVNLGNLGWEIDIVVARSSDICDPRPTWSPTSMSRCTHTSLLRLQEILLAKLAMTGLVLPGISIVLLPLLAVVRKFLCSLRERGNRALVIALQSKQFLRLRNAFKIVFLRAKNNLLRLFVTSEVICSLVRLFLKKIALKDSWTTVLVIFWFRTSSLGAVH